MAPPSKRKAPGGRSASRPPPEPRRATPSAVERALAAPPVYDEQVPHRTQRPAPPAYPAPAPRRAPGPRAREPFRLDSIGSERREAPPHPPRPGPTPLVRPTPLPAAPPPQAPRPLPPAPPPLPPAPDKTDGKPVNLADWVPEVWESKVGAEKGPPAKVAFAYDPAYDSDPFAIPMAFLARAKATAKPPTPPPTNRSPGRLRETSSAGPSRNQPREQPRRARTTGRSVASIGPVKSQARSRAPTPAAPPAPPAAPIALQQAPPLQLMVPGPAMLRIRDVGDPPQSLDDDQAIFESVLRDLHFEVEDADYPGVRRVVSVLENALTKRRFNLAPFPAVAARLVGRTGPPPSDDQLIKMVKSDPALAGKIVATANSPYYMGVVPVNSVPRAVTRLGMLEVRRRCLAAAVEAAFEAVGFGDVMANMQTHALATAMFSEMLSPWARQDPGEAFLAGLLHDAGEVAIYRLVSVGIKDSQRRGEKWRPDSSLLWHLAEYYHPRIGVIFFRGWDLAPAVLSAMAYHHHPHWSAPEHRRLAMLAHIADRLAERAIAHTKGAQWQACMEVRNPDASEETLALAALGDGVDTIHTDDLAELMPAGFDRARMPGLVRSVLLRVEISDGLGA